MLVSILFVALFIAIAISWLYALTFTVLIAENRRFWRCHQRRSAPSSSEYPRCLVVIPCKGMEHQLRDNLSAFLRQDHPNYEVTFVVESANDPAAQLIRNLMHENRCVTTRLVVAGYGECGQKVHNLREATRDLDSDIEILVFADSDAGSKSTWLRWLVGGIGQTNLGARTGYRWMIPRDKKTPTLIGCSINNALASMLGKGSHFLVWGGSWAVHRKVFDSVSLHQAWNGVLSDDLVASRVLRLSKLDVRFEPQSICSTHVSFTWGSLTEFLSRQFVIAKYYATGYWLAAVTLTLLSQVGFWAGLFVGAALVAGGNTAGYLLIGSSAGLLLTGVIRSLVRQNMGRMYFSELRGHRRARKYDAVGGPLNGLLLSALMIHSIFKRTIVWRHVGYHISPGGRVLMLGRRIRKTLWPFSSGQNKTQIPAVAKSGTQSQSAIQAQSANQNKRVA